MVSASGSGRGREQVEVPQVIRDVTNSWDNYCTLKADYESMSDERTRLYGRANEPGCPLVERADILQNQVPALEAELNRNYERRTEMAAGIREKIDEAVSAARRLRGSARTDALASLDSVKAGLQEISEEEAALRQAMETIGRMPEVQAAQAVPQRTTQPAATQAPSQEMVQVAGEWMTRAEYERALQSVQDNIAGIRDMGSGPSVVTAQAAAPQLTPEYSTSYSTVIGWNRRVTEIESENASIIQKIQNYRSKLGEAETEGNTRRESYYNGKIEELEREFDANVAEQSQLMANLTRSLSDALYDAMGNRRHSDALMRIYDEWGQRQAKLLDLIDIRGQGPAETAATYETAKFICTQTIETVYSQMLGVPNSYIVFPPNRPSAEIVQAAQRGVVPTFPPTQTAVVPTTAPQALQVPAGAFQYANPQTGRTYRITIDGMDLSTLPIEEVYAQVYGYANTAANFRHLHVQRLDARGNVDYTYASREHVRDKFFAQQLGWTPYATEAERAASRRVVGEMDRRMQAYFAEGEAPAAAPAAVAAPVAAPRTAEQFLAGNGSLYGVDRAGANQLAGFMNGTRTVLNFDIRGEEQANRVYAMVSAEVGRRTAQVESEGRRLQLTFDRPVTPGGKYHISLQLLGMLETAQQVAVETGNPFAGMLSAEPRVGFPMGVFEESSARFARNNPGMGITVTGYGSPTDVANDPESQAVAYVYDSFRRFQIARFTGGENGWQRMTRLIYTEGDGAQAVATVNGQPILSLEENAAFTAAHYTLEAGRVMRTPTPQGGTEENLEGVRVNVFDGNIRAALEGESNPQDPTYAARAYSLLQAYYNQPNLVELNMAKLLPETQASINAAAEYMGMMMYRARTSVTGEPATAEERGTLLTACVNAARVQLLVKMESEVGMEAAYGTFAWDGKEYQVGASTLVRRDAFPFPRGTELSGARTSTVLFVPSENPGEIIIVGYMGTRREAVGTTGAMVSVPEARLLEPGQEIRYYAGASNPNYRLSPFDSLGLFGLTERWSQNLPLIDLHGAPVFGEPYEDIGAPPYGGLGAEYQDVAPPRVAAANLQLGYAQPELSGVFEHYARGEELSESEYTISNPVLFRINPATRQGEEQGVMPLEEMLDQRNTYLEMAMFRVPRPGQDAYYSTLTPEAQERYADILQNPEDIVHTSELRGGKIYVYVDMATHRIVDALDPRLREAEGEVRQVEIGTYSFTTNEEGAVTNYTVLVKGARDALAEAGVSLAPLDDGRGLVMTQIPGTKILEMVASHEAEIVDNSITLRMRVADWVRSRVGSNPEFYPRSEGYLAVAAVNTYPMYLAATGEVAVSGAYNYEKMVERGQRLAELRSEFAQVAESARTTDDAAQEKAAELRLAGIAIERRQIYDQMLSEVVAAMPSYSGEDRRKLEAFRDSLQESAGPDMETLEAWRTSVEQDTYYSHAYMQSLWSRLEGIHTEFESLSSRYDEAERAGDTATMGALSDEGWRMVLERRGIYDDMVRHINSSSVADPRALEQINGYLAEINGNLGQYFEDVDFEALRAEFAR